MKKLVQKFIADDAGVTLVEYGIALVLAITVGVTILTNLGVAVEGQMNESAAIM